MSTPESLTIELRVGSALRRHLPAGQEGHTAQVHVDAGASLGGLLEQLGVDHPARVMALLNGQLVPLEARHGARLANGDAVSLMPALQAG